MTLDQLKKAIAAATPHQLASLKVTAAAGEVSVAFTVNGNAQSQTFVGTDADAAGPIVMDWLFGILADEPFPRSAEDVAFDRAEEEAAQAALEAAAQSTAEDPAA